MTWRRLRKSLEQRWIPVGPKGKHYPERKAARHGKEKDCVTLGGRKVAVEKVRVRSVDGREMSLET
ncbi:MAG: hypothetical protein OWQ59_09855 [Alicyclobacillaceae bacterium]|jgi:hypothetical protein|nr:hypothetical protein [Alicyclobacillus sp. SP_1]MCY0888745.1 hypothetical protein [Alicyclobacillaceae bacterium]